MIELLYIRRLSPRGRVKLWTSIVGFSGLMNVSGANSRRRDGMSAFGTKQTSLARYSMSAFGGTADIGQVVVNVCL
jgi:hypothetical protein